MNQTLTWFADAVLMVMLGATLIMAVRLDRALRIVARDRGAFETLISSLGAATEAVRLGIQALRAEADRAAEQIQRRCEDADKMATDLSFLIDAADRAGARLEQRVLAVPHDAVSQQAEDPPEPSEKVPVATLDPIATTSWPCGAADELRELAGITTRKRGAEQDQPVAIDQRPEVQLAGAPDELLAIGRAGLPLKLAG